MIHDKRKFTRIDIPIIMEFKPVKETAEYSLGLTRNFSCEGLSFESLDFKHEPIETLELKLKFPRRGTFISVLGDVMWKKQIRDRYLVGVKLKDMSKEIRDEFLEKISSYADIPVSKFFYRKDSEGVEEKKPEEEPETLGIRKQYLPGSVCMVTFILPKDAAPDAQKVTIVGEFNDWNKENLVMKRLENGDFTITLKLKSGREYRFRYLIDGSRWENDWNADRYDPNPFGWHDSVVIV
jgi:hypothetical protein